MDKTMKLKSIARHVATPLTISLTSACILMALPAESNAYIRCDPSDMCARTAQQEGKETRTRISDMETSLTRAIWDATTKIIGALREQTAALTSSGAQVSQAAGENLQKVQQAADAARAIQTQSSTMDCSRVGSSQSGRGGGMASGGSGSANWKPERSNLSEWTQRAIKEGVSQNEPTTDSSKTLAAAGVGGCVDFADPNSALGKICQRIGAPNQGKNPFKDADVKAQTVLKSPDSLRNPNAISSVPAEGEDADARHAYLNMLFEADPAEMIPEAQQGVPGSQEFVGLYRHYRAGKELAAHPTKEFIRLTTIDPKTKDSVEAIKSSHPEFFSRFFSGVSSKYYSEGVSPLTLMELEVESRIGNENWIKNLAVDGGGKNAMTEREVLNEQTLMQALSLRVQFQQLQAQYQTNVILGKLLDTQIESVVRGKVDTAAEEIASRSGILQFHSGSSAPQSTETP